MLSKPVLFFAFMTLITSETSFWSVGVRKRLFLEVGICIYFSKCFWDFGICCESFGPISVKYVQNFSAMFIGSVIVILSILKVSDILLLSLFFFIIDLMTSHVFLIIIHYWQ